MTILNIYHIYIYGKFEENLSTGSNGCVELAVQYIGH